MTRVLFFLLSACFFCTVESATVRISKFDDNFRRGAPLNLQPRMEELHLRIPKNYLKFIVSGYALQRSGAYLPRGDLKKLDDSLPKVTFLEDLATLSTNNKPFTLLGIRSYSEAIEARALAQLIMELNSPPTDTAIQERKKACADDITALQNCFSNSLEPLVLSLHHLDLAPDSYAPVFEGIDKNPKKGKSLLTILANSENQAHQAHAAYWLGRYYYKSGNKSRASEYITIAQEHQHVMAESFFKEKFSPPNEEVEQRCYDMFSCWCGLPHTLSRCTGDCRAEDCCHCGITSQNWCALNCLLCGFSTLLSPTRIWEWSSGLLSKITSGGILKSTLALNVLFSALIALNIVHPETFSILIALLDVIAGGGSYALDTKEKTIRRTRAATAPLESIHIDDAQEPRHHDYVRHFDYLDEQPQEGTPGLHYMLSASAIPHSSLGIKKDSPHLSPDDSFLQTNSAPPAPLISSDIPIQSLSASPAHLQRSRSPIPQKKPLFFQGAPHKINQAKRNRAYTVPQKPEDGKDDGTPQIRAESPAPKKISSSTSNRSRPLITSPLTRTPPSTQQYVPLPSHSNHATLFSPSPPIIDHRSSSNTPHTGQRLERSNSSPDLIVPKSLPKDTML